MNLEPTEDQALLLSTLESLLAGFETPPNHDRRGFYHYSDKLDRLLDSSGFLDVMRTEGTGAVEAAMIIEAVARLSPMTVEIGASALVAPQLLTEVVPRPIALLSGDLAKAQRNLPVARSAFYDNGAELFLIEVDQANVEPVESIYAYPFGRFRTVPGIAQMRSLGAAPLAAYRQWSRVALAAEAAGLIRAAVDFTVDYVRNRQMFGTTLGTFQAVQHRIAAAHQVARASYFLAMKAAWSGEPYDALQAAGFVQQHVQQIVFDLHQFNGGMGVTNEHLLHFWTYRLRALQAENGGANAAALDTADIMWGAAA